MINSFTKEVTTLATCWRIKLRNGKVLGFTDFISDIIFDNLIYKAQSGFYSSAIEINSNLIADNFEISGFLNSDLIKKAEVLEGLFDYAQIEVIIVNYLNPQQDKKIITSGYFGKIKIKDEQFFTEITGLVSVLDNSVTKIYSPTCRAQLGDKECKVTNKLVMPCIITNVVGDEIIIDHEIPSRLYSYGILIANDQKYTIKSCHKFKVIVENGLPELLKPGTLCKLVAGCDKQFNTCCEHYNNAINFRGEPHIPCIEDMFR
jgi:uncharacterized phage protein (TIGR02218 family)